MAETWPYLITHDEFSGWFANGCRTVVGRLYDGCMTVAGRLRDGCGTVVERLHSTKVIENPDRVNVHDLRWCWTFITEGIGKVVKVRSGFGDAMECVLIHRDFDSNEMCWAVKMSYIGNPLAF